MGRSIASLVIMLVAFAALAAFFVFVDTAAGLHVHVQAPGLFASTSTGSTHTPVPALASSSSATPATPIPPTPTRAASDTTPPATAAATPSMTTSTTLAATPTLTPPTASGAATQPATQPAPPGATTLTPMPTPPGGITPPRYGVLPNYTNNTSSTFSAAFLQTLDERIIALTNRQRAAHNLALLSESEPLDIIAASRSQDMVQRHYFDHYDPTGPIDAQGRRTAAVQELLARNSITYTEVGENLIANSGFPLDNNTPQQVVGAWMHHPEHRANILTASYTAIGVGMAAEYEQNNTLRVVITQIFTR